MNKCKCNLVVIFPTHAVPNAYGIFLKCQGTICRVIITPLTLLQCDLGLHHGNCNSFSLPGLNSKRLCVLDPYVKVWLMNKDKRVEKKKTVVMKRCLNPVFNESFPFDVPAHVLRETTIVITVMDKDKLSRNDVIGKVWCHAALKKW